VSGLRPAEGVRSLITAIAASTLVAETLGMLALYTAWASGMLPLPQAYDNPSSALWWAGFHAVSAFNNAGFSLNPDNLMAYVGNPVVCGIVALLILTGGLGFAVTADLAQRSTWAVLRPGAIWARLSLQSKVALFATLGLNAVGMMVFLALEFDGALAGLSAPTKVLASLFEAVTIRTAGFNTVPHGSLASATVLFCIVWMFIGACPGSTGGGVKTTTASVVLMSVRSMLSGRDDVELFGRRIHPVVVYRSISIVLIALGAITAFLMLLVTIETHIPFEKLAFEAASAFGTVGLSMDVTPRLDAAGRWIIICLMFVGRVGPLTLALAIGERARSKTFRYPAGHLAVG
jgi:trk system potassium uptake protein TrkH